jgi:ribosome biogenesis ATPase
LVFQSGPSPTQLLRFSVVICLVWPCCDLQEAQDVAPSIIFIDEIDAIAPKRDTAQREMERRIVAQMLTCMDDLAAPPAAAAGAAAAAAVEGTAGDASAAAEADDSHIQQYRRGHVVVIGATNRPDALDPALRRAGRFDREISLGIPTEAARCQILKVLSRSLRLQGGFDFHAIARRTPGFVGADLAALTKEAAAVAVSRIFSQLEQHRQQRLLQAADQQQQDASATAPTDGAAGGSLILLPAAAAAAADAAGPRIGGGPLSAAELSDLAISMSDFEAALPKVQPSVRREGFTTKPDATWDDVGSLEEVKTCVLELMFSWFLSTQPLIPATQQWWFVRLGAHESPVHAAAAHGEQRCRHRLEVLHLWL